MLISHKREFLARRLRDVGLLALLERVARRPCLVVLCYHRIGSTDGNPFYDPIVSATPEFFAAQVGQLRRRYRMIGPEAFEELVENGFRPSEPSILITFDDAYRDNIDLAFPILREQAVPAAFFVPTGFVDRPRLTWWDHVAFTIKSTKVETLTLDIPERISIDLRTLAPPEAIEAVVRPFLRSNPSDEERLLAHLDERAKVEVDSGSLGGALFANWDQIRALAEAGMIVGSHTRDHLNLARQTEAEQRIALVDSRARLEQELGREIISLAYPYGSASDFNATTQRVAREAGYRVAFSTIARVNRPGKTNALNVHRMFVGSAHTPVLLRARVALGTAFGKPIL